MSWITLAVAILNIAMNLWQYFMSADAAKAKAAQAIADQFKLLESNSQPIMVDILTRMGRASWVPWDAIPADAQPVASGEQITPKPGS